MTTFIGIGVYGDGGVFDPATSFIRDVNTVEIKNAIYDEVVLYESELDNVNERGRWNSLTKFLARFNGNLEAGNIALDEAEISGLKIKRKRTENDIYTDLDLVDYVPNSLMSYKDYFARSEIDYNYAVVPVDVAGIEGVITPITTTPQFEGWWLIDPDYPEENNFQFFYNIDDMTITTDEDRSEISTFGKYPLVRYGQKRAKRGSLTGLLIPEGENVVKQYKRLDYLTKQHKPLLLKDSKGRSCYVDVSAPQEVVLQKPSGLSKVTINWVEVDEYND